MTTTTTTAKTIAPSYVVALADVTLTVTAKLAKEWVSFPNDENGNTKHNQFRVTLKSSNGEKAQFAFYDSASNRAKGIKQLDSEALKGALECFISDATTALNCKDADDMMAEFGWDSDSRKQYQRAQRIYKACQKASAKFDALGLDEGAQFDLANLLSA